MRQRPLRLLAATTVLITLCLSLASCSAPAQGVVGLARRSDGELVIESRWCHGGGEIRYTIFSTADDDTASPATETWFKAKGDLVDEWNKLETSDPSVAWRVAIDRPIPTDREVSLTAIHVPPAATVDDGEPATERAAVPHHFRASDVPVDDQPWPRRMLMSDPAGKASHVVGTGAELQDQLEELCTER